MPNFLIQTSPDNPDFVIIQVNFQKSPSGAGLWTPNLMFILGLSFCPGCHWNALSPTPARYFLWVFFHIFFSIFFYFSVKMHRIIHNWDFEPRPVSQATKQYLYLMHRKPVSITRLNFSAKKIDQSGAEFSQHFAISGCWHSWSQSKTVCNCPRTCRSR